MGGYFSTNEFGELGDWAKPDPATEHFHFIFYHLCYLMKARTTVEVGIGRAFCAYVLGHYAKEVGGQHYEIDVAITPILRAKQVQKRWDLPVTILHQDSNTIEWPKVSDKKIDLIFIDGHHSYEKVRGDIEVFVPYVRRNGLVFFHDYHNKRWEVKQAVDEMHNPDRYEMLELPYTSIGCAAWRVR
jgi:predicted O-methyltransferase YrrM